MGIRINWRSNPVMPYNIPPPAMSVPQALPVPGPMGAPQPMANPGAMGAPMTAPPGPEMPPMTPQAPPTGGVGMYGMPQGQMPAMQQMGPPESLAGPLPPVGPPPGYGMQKNFSLEQPYGQNTYGLNPAVTPKHIVDHLFSAIPNVESRGEADPYKALAKPTPQNPNPTASGRYQYINSTWGNYGGYKRAMDAPPEIQDRRFKEDLQRRIQKFKGDPFKAVAEHISPRFANDPFKWNQPMEDSHGKEIPGAGTVAQYLSKVLGPQRVQQYLATIGSGNANR